MQPYESGSGPLIVPDASRSPVSQVATVDGVMGQLLADVPIQITEIRAANALRLVMPAACSGTSS